MTVVSVLSVKGSPGVTTLSCLVAATWPGTGAATVVEADPAGGDLAARFGLAPAVGWPSLRAAVRRGGDATTLGPHLQYLPGGLAVLVGARGGDVPPGDSAEAAMIRSASDLVVVDLGRVIPTVDGDFGPAAAWLRSADASLLVVTGDVAGALQVRAHASALADVTDGRIGLAVVGSGNPSGAEVGTFVGLRTFGDVPVDAPAAAVASGASGAGRRLERSRLLASARRLAGVIAAREGAGLADTREPVVSGTGCRTGPTGIGTPVTRGSDARPVPAGTPGRVAGAPAVEVSP